MKRMSSGAWVAATVICGWMTGVQAGVVAYYDFAGSGTDDASGHGYSLVSTGSVVFANGAAVFNGTAPLLSSDALLMGTYSNLTVEFYMKTTNNKDEQLLELGPSGTSASNKGSFDFYYQGASDSGKLYAWYQSSSGSNRHVSPTGVNDGNWHHVAMVIDASKAETIDYVTVYLDRQAIPINLSNNGLNNIRNDRLYFGARIGTAANFFIGTVPQEPSISITTGLSWDNSCTVATKLRQEETFTTRRPSPFQTGSGIMSRWSSTRPRQGL